MPPDHRLNNLERDVADIKSRLDSINVGINNVGDRLLPVPWNSARWTAGLIATVFTGVICLYVFHVVPTQIDNKVGPLQTRVEGIASSGGNPGAEIGALGNRLDEGLNLINKRLDDSLRGVNERIDNLFERLVGTPSRFRSSLERVMPKKEGEAKAAFPVARELVARAREKRVALKPEELERVALPLLKTKYDDEEARVEAWATAKEFAAYRTLVNKLLFGEPKPQGQTTENYFKCSPGGAHNLGSRSEWKGTVFVNCRIDIEHAQATLALDKVRFINCDFSPLDETSAARTLVAAVLSADGPSVTVPLLNNRMSEAKTGS